MTGSLNSNKLVGIDLHIMLDSGAFSIFRRGIPLPIQDYIDYCKRHKDQVAAYVNLDCIPGENGHMDHSQTAIEKSASKSYENLQIMKAAGLSPIPVFHQGERFEWLERMLQDGETYIGISPYLRSHQNEIIKWMDQCFTRVTDSKGWPLVKTHGFGVTACNLCIRYPWTSVDSTSWSVGGGYGTILVPQYVNGTPDYSKPPLSLKMSARKQDQSRGFDGLSPSQQDIVRQAVADAGVTMGELRNTFMGRWRLNMKYFQGMSAACDGKAFANKARSLFGSAPVVGKGFKPQPLRMYFATVLHTKHHNEFLNECKIENRLLSYAFLRELPDEFLGQYIETGLPEQKVPRVKKTRMHNWSSETYRVRRSNSLIKIKQREDVVE